MKRLLVLIMLLYYGSIFAKIDTLRARSKITDVTVFFSGAQVTRTDNVKLGKGKTLVKFEKLPVDINPKSIQVERMPYCKILSVKHESGTSNITKKDSALVLVRKKIKTHEHKIKEYSDKLNVYEIEEKLLIDNSVLAKDNTTGSKVADIREAADFYRARISEIRQAKLKLITELDSDKEYVQELYSKLNEIISEKDKVYSRILVMIESEKETINDLKVSYYVNSAGWEPLYDFRVDDISKPLVIVYNANVYQTSGEDWKNVNIKLYTSNPSLSGTKPELRPWFLGRHSQTSVIPLKAGVSALKGTVFDMATNETLPFVNVIAMKGDEKVATVTTDIEGQFSIKPIPTGLYNLKANYVGYTATQVNSIKLEADKTTTCDLKMRAGVELAAVEIVEYKKPFFDSDFKTGSTVTRESFANMASKNINSVASTTDGLNIRGARSEGTVYYVDGQKVISPEDVKSTSYISNTLRTTMTSMEYTIDLPYTIASDGEDYNIKIKEVSLPVAYKFNAVPKLDNDAFLSAAITDWTSLNLLSGKSSIYYQGTFTGESVIDANNMSDTLTISLGRDKNIVVKRDGNRKLFDRKILSSEVSETMGWDITVKNNRSARIKIVVEDQIPVSDRKSMEVKLMESAGAVFDAKTGKLLWTLELDPNERKVLTYKYHAEYPKYVEVDMD